MKGLTSKFALSVLSLVLTGVALSVGIYAWFTINNVATVEAFTADVQSGSGLYVSTDIEDDSWTNIIANGDIVELSTFAEFVPVTTQNGIVFQTLAGSATTTGVLSFTLYFAGSSDFDTVVVTELLLSSTETTWQPLIAVDGTRSEGNAAATLIEYASNAARVSFVDLVAETATIFEQEAGANEAEIGTGHGNSLGFLTDATNEAVLFYNALETESITLPDPVPYTANEAGTQLAFDVATLVDAASIATELSLTPSFASIEGVVGEDAKFAAVKVNVWIEGWDAEALNAILSGSLTVSFVFGAAA